MRKRLSTIAVVLAALLFGSVGAAAAQYSEKGSELTSAQVKSKLEAAGYSNVHGIEREGAHFDADASKDGKPAHLHVDAKSGAVTVVTNESEESEEHESDHRP